MDAFFDGLKKLDGRTVLYDELARGRSPAIAADGTGLIDLDTANVKLRELREELVTMASDLADILAETKLSTDEPDYRDRLALFLDGYATRFDNHAYRTFVALGDRFTSRDLYEANVTELEEWCGENLQEGWEIKTGGKGAYVLTKTAGDHILTKLRWS